MELNQQHLDFLKELNQNNNREWFDAHKTQFLKIQEDFKTFFNEIFHELQKYDNLESIKNYRIYRDIRFSSDKTPYNPRFAVSFARTKPHLRGGYYLHIAPQENFVGGGFWEPNPTDLLRIRKEIELDDTELRKLITQPTFIKHFQTLQGEEVKSAPKGFDKNHPAIDLIRKKQFLVSQSFSNSQVTSPNFKAQVIESFKAMRPFFDYMSDILGTDLNGNPIY